MGIQTRTLPFISFIDILVITYHPAVTGVSSCFCHYDATCEWLLVNPTPAVSGHHCFQTCVDGKILNFCKNFCKSTLTFLVLHRITRTEYDFTPLQVN